ncbi:MAG: nucleotidyltransferase family protein [candidate division KSB1 bacterium]|nr:nucleotidyltransferase family protein [candidate division KSB1 bacterium]
MSRSIAMRSNSRVAAWYESVSEGERISSAEASPHKLAAIVLAAGEGKRLAQFGPKPFLTCHGKSFLKILAEHLSAIRVNPLVIVTNEVLYQKVVELNPSGQILINPQPQLGMISSLWIGLNAIDSTVSGFFMCPIDYPLVRPETYHHLAEAHFAFPHRIIIPAHNGHFGHPVIFPKELCEELKRVPLDQGAKFLIHSQSDLILPVAVPDPGILININTPELYQKYCK